MNDNQDTAQPTPPHLPDAETILEELAKLDRALQPHLRHHALDALVID